MNTKPTNEFDNFIDAFVDELIELRQDDDAVHDRDAEQRDEADRRRDAEGNAGDDEADDAAEDRHGDHAHRQQRVDHRAEIEPEQDRDQRQTDRHHDGQALDRVLQIAELADPFHVRAGRQRRDSGDGINRQICRRGGNYGGAQRFDDTLELDLPALGRPGEVGRL